MPKTILSKLPYARCHTGFAKAGDTSGTKARIGVASTVHAGAGTTVNHTPASEGPAEEDSTMIAAPISGG